MVSNRLNFLFPIFLFLPFSLFNQNLLSNPNFTEIDTCPYDFGQVFFASPWNSDNDQSPDLYDSCAVGGFYPIPQEFLCATLVPKKDNGFVGIVTFGILPNGSNIREILSARLTEEPPPNTDIYCSMIVSPRPRCITNPNIPNHTCYSNGIGLAMVYQNESKEIIFQADEVVDNIGTWRTLQGCYEPKGNEVRIQIQNFYDNSVTKSDCFTINEDQNSGYTFVDNVVVAPFDILPDTLVICNIEQIEFQETNFYDLPLSWSDGTQGVARTFEQSGNYTLLADAENCILEESMHVVVIDESVLTRVQTISKCIGENTVLTLDVPGRVVWDNQHRGASITVSEPGSYMASLLTNCDTIEISFEVSNIDCEDVVYAPNIFSPNDDNINERLIFYIRPEVTIRGTLEIYDRWGSKVLQITSDQEMTWNGKNSSGSVLEEGVYIWIFKSQDKSIIQTGDITLIR